MNKVLISVCCSALLIFSCKMGDGNADSTCITLNIGFDDLKTHQGVLKQKNGIEEIYFYKTEFHPQIKFFDLNGEPKDSISLIEVEKHIGRIGKVSLISKDSIVIISYRNEKVVGIDRKGNYLFEWTFEYLNKDLNDHYRYYGSTFPTGIIYKHNSLICTPSWQYNKQKKKNGTKGKQTRFESYKEYYEGFCNSYHLCKIDSIFTDRPKTNLILKEYYTNLNKSIRSYYVNARYFIVDDYLLYGNTYDRNIYRIELSSMEIIDTIPIIPPSFKIPSSFGMKEEDLYGDITLKEEEDVKNNCYISNILYDDEKKEYYFFLKTGIDKSAIDEKGYSFEVFVYNSDFKIKRKVSFDTDVYIPKSAMITTKGILIEKFNSDNPYGKKTFCFLDI